MARRKQRNVDIRDAKVTKGTGAGKPAVSRRSFVGENPASSETQWWRFSGQEAADALDESLSQLWFQAQYRLQRLHDFGWLYGNASASFTIGGLQGSYRPLRPSSQTKVTYNIIQTVIDTLTAKVAKNSPKPYFLTSGGTFKEQRKAKKRNKALQGIFYENKMRVLGPQTFKSGCVDGTGIIHVFKNPKTNRIELEPVLTSELFVDDADGFYGHPRVLHRVKAVDRRVLMGLYPKKRKELEECNAMQFPSGSGMYQADLLMFRVSWHLPSSPGADDGKVVVSVPEHIIEEAPWTRNHFPFAVFRPSPRLTGWYGQSICEQLEGIQLEMNRLLWVIQRSMYLAGSFKVFLRNDSKLVKEHVNNDIGSVVIYAGDTPPTYYVPPIVPPEIYEQFDRLKASGFERVGISPLTAAAQKPAGLNSGAALRTFDSIEDDRLMEVWGRYEQFYIDLGVLAIEAVQDAAEEDGGYEIEVPGTRVTKVIDWKDIAFDKDEEPNIECFPISNLPSDPEGRLASIQEYIQAGFLTQRQGKKLLDFPDLEAVENLENAEEDYLSMVLDGIMDGEEYEPPAPEDDLQLAEEMAMEYLAQAKVGGESELVKNELRTYLSQVRAITAPPVPQPQTTGAPQAPPTAPQPSNLVPNVPGGGAPGPQPGAAAPQ